MIGAIVGDLVGSIYENENTRSYDFPLFTRFSHFTDDTVLTVAIADAILHRQSVRFRWLQPHHNRQMYALRLKAYGRRYPHAGYGQQFQEWLSSESMRGYGSYGNGAAMRVSAIGYAFDQLETVLREARWSAVVTHNHAQAVKGAQAVAGAVFLARTGTSKAGIREWVENRFGYNLRQSLENLRQTYTFDSSCQGSVPQAFIAFSNPVTMKMQFAKPFQSVETVIQSPVCVGLLPTPTIGIFHQQCYLSIRFASLPIYSRWLISLMTVSE